MEQTSDHFKSFFEASHACWHISKLEAEKPVFAFLPACAHSQDHTSAAQVIQRCRLARQ